MESKYTLDNNGMRLLYKPQYRVENMREIRERGIIELTPVGYFPHVAYIVTGCKPGCSETIQWVNPDSWWQYIWFKPRTLVQVNEVIQDNSCTVVVSETDWKVIKVVPKGKMKVLNIDEIRAGGMIDIRVESDLQYSYIKVRGIRSGKDEIRWSSWKLLWLIDYPNTTTVMSINSDLKTNLGATGRTEIYQDRWNRLVNVKQDQEFLRIRNMANMNKEGIYQLSINGEGGSGVYVKPLKAAIGEISDIEWSIESYIVLSELGTNWNKVCCVVTSGITDSTSKAEQDFIEGICKIVEEGEESQECEDQDANVCAVELFDPRRSANPLTNSFVKFLTVERDEIGYSFMYQHLQKLQKRPNKSGKYLLHLFPSENYIAALFALMNKLMGHVAKQKTERMRKLQALAHEVYTHRTNDMRMVEARIQGYKESMKKMNNDSPSLTDSIYGGFEENKKKKMKEFEKKVILERYNRALHAYAVDAWGAIHKMLADVILIKRENKAIR